MPKPTLPSLEPKYSSSRTRITIPNRFGTQGSDSDGVERCYRSQRLLRDFVAPLQVV